MSSSYLIIGNGRLANHLKHYFDVLSVNFKTWYRGAEGITALEKLLAEKRIVLLAISDSAIASFVSAHLSNYHFPIVHFSAAMKVTGTMAFHPLMTFSKDLYDPSLYIKIPFVGSEPKETFKKLFPKWDNSYYQIAPQDMAYYHALCVLGGNLTCFLIKNYLEEMEKRFEISSDVSLRYIRQVFENLSEDPENSLTGPLVRQDWKTIHQNQQALLGEESPLSDLYDSFVRSYERSLKKRD